MRTVLILIVLALMGATATATAHAATKSCGLTARIDGSRYDVRETKGKVPCATVKRAVTTFLRSGEAPKPWTCTRGHGYSPYAASCAQGKKVLVRVYAPK
jgi:hypothetical protein